MIIAECILLLLLIVAGAGAVAQKNVLHTVIIFTAFGLIMSVLWIFLQAPDLAITEAAVGAGATSVLFYLTLHRCGELKKDGRMNNEKK